LCQFPRLEHGDLISKLEEEVEKYTKEYDAYVKKIGKDKSKKKEMRTVEQYRQDIEKDMDRSVYCEIIEKEIAIYNKPEKSPANNIESKLF
jgi:vacuolar-type H+-ATPase subunit I/STV1